MSYYTAELESVQRRFKRAWLMIIRIGWRGGSVTYEYKAVLFARLTLAFGPE